MFYSFMLKIIFKWADSAVGNLWQQSFEFFMLKVFHEKNMHA